MTLQDAVEERSLLHGARLFLVKANLYARHHAYDQCRTPQTSSVMRNIVQKSAEPLSMIGKMATGKITRMKDGRSSGTVVLVFTGEYDIASKDQVRAACDAVSLAPRVALDFSDVTYIDSTIIHELIRMHNTRAAGGLERETLVVRNGNLLRIFELLQLASVFHVVASLDEAIDRNGQDIAVQHASAFNGSPLVNGAVKAAIAEDADVLATND